jgi:hypothetical protein
MANYLGSGGFDPSAYMMRKLMDKLFKDKTPERRQLTSDMEALVKMADTEEGLFTAKKAFNEFDKSNDNWGGLLDEAGDIIGHTLNAKMIGFSKYKTSLSQAQEYFDSGPLDKEKLMKYTIDDFEDLSREIRKLSEIDTIISSGNNNFRYSIKDGQSNEMLKENISARVDKIDSSLKGLAMAGQIPEELVEFVLMGEPGAVKTKITTERSKWKGLINKNLSYLKHAHNILARSNVNVNAGNVTLNPDDENDSAFLKMLSQITTGQAKNTYDVPTMKRWVEDFTDEDTRLNAEYSRWSRTKYNANIDLEDLNKQYQKSKKSNFINNPGNLKFRNQVGSTGKDNRGFAIFPTEDAGWKALYNQINKDKTRNFTLNEFVNKYAPPSENDTAAYIDFLGKELDVSSGININKLDTKKLAVAIAKQEGYKGDFPDISSGSNKNDESINAYGDNQQHFSGKKLETDGNVLEVVTGKNVSELKKDASNKDQTFFERLFGLPVVREQLKKNRREFEGALKAERDSNLNRRIKGAENYLAESLWKKMPKKEKSKHKKLSNFKNYFNNRMKSEYEKNVESLNYQGTYLAWIKEQIESAGIYMPMGISIKTPF